MSTAEVSVVSWIEIARPRVEVADYAADPDNATDWYENIKTVQWRSPRPLAVGSRIAFVAAFLGRRIAWTVHEHFRVRSLPPCHASDTFTAKRVGK